MRVVALVVLLGCGEHGSSVFDAVLTDAPPPSITGLTNNTACRGGGLGVIGSNLDGGIARINGVQAIFAGSGPDRLLLTVDDLTPAGTAPIVVETAGGMASSPPFNVQDRHTPEVTGHTPMAGRPNDVVMVTGSDLADGTLQLFRVMPPLEVTVPPNQSNTPTTATFVIPNIAPGDYDIRVGAAACGIGGGTRLTVL